jgi:uncharacterized glyoxalase superfamily protein PhnB
MSASPSPAFIGVHLTVKDMVTSASFYRCLGLAVPDDTDLGEHVEIDLGHGVHLALSTERVTRMYDPGWRTPGGPPAGALQFQVTERSEVDTLYNRLLEAGNPGHLAPIDAFWGNRYAEVEDPDGNVAGIHSLTDPSRRS